MNKKEVIKKLSKLIKERENIENEIKKTVWDSLYPNKSMPETFFYKKIIREEFGLVI